MFKSYLIASGALFFGSVANASSDPFDWNIGEVYRNSLYEYERGVYRYLAKGHTIDKHWDKQYSYLSQRCILEDSSGTYSTWRNKSTAYDRIKKKFRKNEANMANLAASQDTRGTYYRFFNSQYSDHGQLVRCSLPITLRYPDYLVSGTKKTKIIINGVNGRISMITAFPIY